MQSIKVRHNVEMAHRLFESPGKCENIHGHSWWVELELIGTVGFRGILLEFGDVKKRFREYLDTTYDHQLILNSKDPWVSRTIAAGGQVWRLPGMKPVHGDPTTENLARWIGEWAQEEFFINNVLVNVTVWETSVNCATWSGGDVGDSEVV